MSAGRVLIIAGSDSGGGAGIQADIKTVTALGGYAMTALTAVTVQDTTGVHGVHPVPPGIVADQIRVCLADIGADAIKTGMLGSAETAIAVAETLRAHAPGVPLIVDPVMVAKGGARLLHPGAEKALKEHLLLIAEIATPNAPEAEALTGAPVRDEADLAHAGQMILSLGPSSVLMKGGHLELDPVPDLLVTPDGVRRFAGPRIETRATHGTGCTLASAIAAGRAQGLSIEEAVARARAYLRAAIAAAPGLGRGHGPLGHGFACRFEG